MGKKELKVLINRIRSDQKVRNKVKKRMEEFNQKNKKDNKSWFNELCFCLLTANASAKKGIEVQNYLIKINGFEKLDQKELENVLKRLGQRFYHRRSEFIVKARKYKRIKEIITGFQEEAQAREWLVEHIKGIGYKEASHFLRNVGYHNIAILDRHIIRILNEHNLIDEVPKNITPKKYLEIEKIILEVAKEIKVFPSEMDLYLWYCRTGEVLK
jgi:N-glycosylase/DNA lyase